MGETYKKASGSAGSKGTHFQINLLSVVLLNALRQSIKGWKLSTDNIEAGKFDDVVFECDDGAILLQAKHKETKKITLDNLLSTNAKNDDFSLPKYFLSYLDVRSKFPVKLIIICTNTEADPEVLQFLTKHIINEENILHYRDGASFFTFNEGIVPDLIKNAKLYREHNLKGKGFDVTLVTEDNAREFLKHLQIYIDYSSKRHLEKAIEKLLSSLTSLSNLLSGISVHDIHIKIKEWFEQPKGEYLTEYRANAMFCEIKSEKHQEVLKNYKVAFKSNNFQALESQNRIIHLITEGGYLIDLMYIFHNLQHSSTSKVLYIGGNNCSDLHKKIIKAFELPQYSHLIIASELVEESLISEMIVTLKHILENRKYKKVIILGEHDNLLVQRLKLIDVVYEVLDESLTLENLSEGSQEMLLSKKNIILQGQQVSLKELLPEQISDHYIKSINSTVLEKLVTDEKITVGRGFEDSEPEIWKYYIDRKFERKVKENERVMNKSEIITEEEICNVTDKMILISDTAGMGKTTVLKKLAIKLKKNNPLVCVFRIELNQCTQILRDYKLQRRSINIWELLKCTNSIQLTTKFEKYLIPLIETIVMLDGLDEISPDYTEQILDLLQRSQKVNHLKKVFLTTRPHIADKFKSKMSVTVFALLPLTEKDQIDFLVRYWQDSLNIGQIADISRCEQYAKTLISKVASWIKIWSRDVKFTSSPLHTKIISEVFLQNTWSEDWEGIKEFMNTDEREPKLPEKMNIGKLYRMFIERKKDIFVEKGNPNGNTIANNVLSTRFDDCLDYHRSLALKTIFNESDVIFFSSYKDTYSDNDERTALEMGIIQRLNNGLMFVHRTFTEYFVAESILKELQLENSNVNFQSLLIDKILSRYDFIVIRHFLNNFLQKCVLSLSTGVFKNYMSMESNTPNNHLIHGLAGEGNTEIIRLVLKLINVKIIKRKNKKKRKTVFKEPLNTLTILRHKTKLEGLNIKNEDKTPLHAAAENGHLDTVKFLLEMGSDINSTSKFNVSDFQQLNADTPLHRAARYGYVDLVDFLVKHGADINIQNVLGYTALHFAVISASYDIISFLVKQGININIGDNEGATALHLSVVKDNFDAVKFLIEHDSDINITDGEGRTPLHFAIRNNNLKMVEFLVELGADTNIASDRGHTALHFAAMKRDCEIFKILTFQLIWKDKTIFNNTNMQIEHLNVVKYLVEQGVTIDMNDRENNTPLHFAAHGADSDIVHFLVENGANVNIANNEGNTVLHFAVHGGSLDIVKFLIKNGADINAANNKGNTVLHFAVERKNYEIIHTLFELNVAIYSINSNHELPFQFADKANILKFDGFLLNIRK